MKARETSGILDRHVLERGFYIFLILLLCFALMYWIVGNQWRVRTIETEPVAPQKTFLASADDLIIEQSFAPPMDTIQSLSLWPVRNSRETDGEVLVEILRQDTVLYTQMLSVSMLPDNQPVTLAIPDGKLSGVKDEPLKLRLTVRNTSGALPVNFAYGSQIDVGRFTIDTWEDLTGLQANGVSESGILYYVMSGYSHWAVIPLFLGAAVAILLLELLVTLIVSRKSAHGQSSAIHKALFGWQKYHFLLRQLVSRDFKIKYKHSSLGLLWSFFNPLLTMLIQYLVFSTLFRSSIENFPLYLLSGIVLFAFFNECIASGMESITANASLINKVYVPLAIFPLSKVISALINLMISFILLIGAMILSGAPFTKALLLMPAAVGMLILFCLGMTFLLATLNVFFRDMKFLWGVISLIWMYATPIFYPESIIPENFSALYRLNPLYHFITMIRTILIYGKSPDPLTFIWSFAYAFFMLLIGLWLFRKKQDRFFQYL